MAYATLLTERHDRVLLIRLNRPQALNALNSELLDELGAALETAAAEDDVACVVLTGSEKAFAAGADIREMSPRTYAEMYREDAFTGATRKVERFRKPLIAAVSGFALGGGCELAMMCDFIIASETARFGQPEITLGIAPGMGGSQRLARCVGKAKAMEMVLTGRMMDAAEAERAGLVSRVTPADKVLDEALAAARKIADQAPLAVMMNKELVNIAFDTTLSTGVTVERRLFQSLFALEDQKEGMAAFLEKRPPQFKGR